MQKYSNITTYNLLVEKSSRILHIIATSAVSLLKGEGSFFYMSVKVNVLDNKFEKNNF